MGRDLANDSAVRIIRIVIYFAVITAVWKCGGGELQLVISFTTMSRSNGTWKPVFVLKCYVYRPYSIVIGM